MGTNKKISPQNTTNTLSNDDYIAFYDNTNERVINKPINFLTSEESNILKNKYYESVNFSFFGCTTKKPKEIFSKKISENKNKVYIYPNISFAGRSDFINFAERH